MATRYERPRYELTERLGGGGMGVVYRGRKHLLMNESVPVAVKVLHRKDLDMAERLADERPDDHGSDESAQAIRLFQQEGKESLRVNHGSLNLVTVFDYGISAKGYGYLIMELVEGGNLRDVMPRAPRTETQSERLSSDVVRRIAFDVLIALDHLHTRGKIHGDVKPENILLSRAGDIKLADLGLVKGANDPGSGRFRGTPVYAAPEVLTGRNVSGSSDLYSLGVVLHELLTGALMNGAGEPDTLVYAAEKKTAAAPLPEDAPADLFALIHGFTGFQPSRRTLQTAAEGLALLEDQGLPLAGDEDIAQLVDTRAPDDEARKTAALPALGWPFEARELPPPTWRRRLPWVLIPIAFMGGGAVVGKWFPNGMERVGAPTRTQELTVTPGVEERPEPPDDTPDGPSRTEPSADRVDDRGREARGESPGHVAVEPGPSHALAESESVDSEPAPARPEPMRSIANTDRSPDKRTQGERARRSFSLFR